MLQGYAKMDTDITMNMQGELFEVSPLQPETVYLKALHGETAARWCSALSALTNMQAVWGAQFVDSNGDYAGALTLSINASLIIGNT